MFHRIGERGFLRADAVTGAEQKSAETDAATFSERLRRVIDVGVALNAQLSLDDLLRLIVESAADLTQARYAALGVIDARGCGSGTIHHSRRRRGDSTDDR